MAMDDDLGGRVARLEERSGRHRDEISELRAKQAEHHADVRGVIRELSELRQAVNQFKWTAIGGLSFAVAQQMGLIEFLKQVM